MSKKCKTANGIEDCCLSNNFFFLCLLLLSLYTVYCTYTARFLPSNIVCVIWNAKQKTICKTRVHRVHLSPYSVCTIYYTYMNLYAICGMEWPLGFALHFWIGNTCHVYIFLCRQKDNWSQSAEQSFIVCNAQNVICQSGQSHVDHSCIVSSFLVFIVVVAYFIPFVVPTLASQPACHSAYASNLVWLTSIDFVWNVCRFWPTVLQYCSYRSYCSISGHSRQLHRLQISREYIVMLIDHSLLFFFFFSFLYFKYALQFYLRPVWSEQHGSRIILNHCVWK